MAQVTIVDKKLVMSLIDIVRFQLNIYCFAENIKLSPSQLNTLAHLGVWGEMNISDFCEEIVRADIFGNPQTVRNFILTAVKLNLVERTGMGNKIIKMSDKLELKTEGNILINLKGIHVETQES